MIKQAGTLLVLVVLIAGCKKKDNRISTQSPNTATQADHTAPAINLKGAPQFTLELQSQYPEAGASASDEHDGDLTSKIKIENPVNTDYTGTYVVKYSVSDAAGNTASASRTVTVKNHADYMTGYYKVAYTSEKGSRNGSVVNYQLQSLSDYDAIIEASNTTNNQVTVSRIDYNGHSNGPLAILLKPAYYDAFMKVDYKEGEPLQIQHVMADAISYYRYTNIYNRQ